MNYFFFTKSYIRFIFKGIELINQLINEYSLEVVQAYMFYIQVKKKQKNLTKLIKFF
jgi:hypothetical protein